MSEGNETVRSREEQACEIHDATAKAVCKGRSDYPETVYHAYINAQLQEAEARGAAEQRRKDVEGSIPCHQYFIGGYWVDCSPERYSQVMSCPTRILYLHPANVAALEDRVREWQPIETGPIDETVVLLFLPDTREIITGYSDGKRGATSNKLIWYETLSGYGYEWDTCLYDTPTHWMPLPSPPKNAKGTPS